VVGVLVISVCWPAGLEAAPLERQELMIGSAS
jgi:hypothetical protein